MNQTMSLLAFHRPVSLDLLRSTPESDCDLKVPQPTCPVLPPPPSPSLTGLLCVPCHTGLLCVPCTLSPSGFHIWCFFHLQGGPSTASFRSLLQPHCLKAASLTIKKKKKYPAPITLYNLTLLYFSSEHISLSDIMIFSYLNLF